MSTDKHSGKSNKTSLVNPAENGWQNGQHEKAARELLAALAEIGFQNKEKALRAAELIVANNELAYQNSEKKKRAKELLIANRKLVSQNKSIKKCAADLEVANAELAHAAEYLKKAAEYQTGYIHTLEKMMFITSHELRRPIANILGILHHVENIADAPAELEEMKGFMKESVQSLDGLTRQMTALIYTEETKLKSI